ncbi:hypothetical protein P171DRAFT_464965 [Karstenula rhodostoma CBS 690.94]|uniref:Aminoglycoside phosphotransferase domain-containing protein n=1 Tax=Karstenula rhodostoma CBS 690.94 TaxID=1392251 RepID=A0A9P4PC19_9PLEO|nr:hypothetical protein P171DRAFT_464965 [Karstenula rhodostoma CBS 690.94]
MSSPIQTRHDLNDDALGKYLQQHLSDLSLPVISTKIGYGQSNPTYFVDDAKKQRYILRKKPSGTIISPVAHQVDREYPVLQALGTVKGFLVPRLAPGDRRAAWFSVISTLAWLHSIDPDAIGLSYGKKTNFYARHCTTFSRIEAQQAQPRVVAILNWELSTIGHPLMDCVYVTGPYWNRYSKVGLEKPRDDQGGEAYNDEKRAESGMPDMGELLDEYSGKAGWDPRGDRWEVAKVFHLMSGGTISHGIQARTISGQAQRKSLDAALEMVSLKKEEGPKSNL